MLADSGVHAGFGVVRVVARRAKGVLLGRSCVYALVAGGQEGVEHLIDLFAADMIVTMTLVGAKSLEKDQPRRSRAPETRARSSAQVRLTRTVARAACCSAGIGVTSSATLDPRYYFTAQSDTLRTGHGQYQRQRKRKSYEAG